MIKLRDWKWAGWSGEELGLGRRDRMEGMRLKAANWAEGPAHQYPVPSEPEIEVLIYESQNFPATSKYLKIPLAKYPISL